VLALDIGGSKIEAAVVHADGRVESRQRVATDPGSPELFAAVESLLHEVRQHHDVVALGVGCGGPMTRNGESVSPLNIPTWRGFPLRSRLSTVTGLPTFVDNDAKALALAEGRFGSAQGRSDYLSMVVSTGIGGGIVLDGRLLDGRDGNAGHIGHVIVEPDGRPCACGSRGCLEAEASGTAIASMTGRPPSEADSAMRLRVGTLVGRAVATTAALLDLNRCYVAGSVALGFGDVFVQSANDEIAVRSRIAHARDLTLSLSGLGTDGPILGSSLVARRRMLA
jgi:glucokinase